MTTTTRRALLTRTATAAAAAVLPLAGLPAIAALAEPDPVFALIERHRAAHLRHGEAVHVFSDAGEPYGGPEDAEVVDAAHAEDEIAIELMDTEPTTLAGVAALLRYAADYEIRNNQWPVGIVDDDDPSEWAREHGRDWHFYLCNTLASAIDNLAVQS